MTGALLFYVARGGEQVWNRNHQKMPNGDSLGGDNSTNQTCIVPVIDSPGIYYVFSLPYQQRAPGLVYSIVDMSLANGMGDIRPGQKAMPLMEGPMAEAVTAMPGNNCDVWLMAQKALTLEFVAFNITKDGINPNYVVSKPGRVDSTHKFGFGGIYVSPDRKIIHTTAFRVLPGSFSRISLLYKFDAGTGKVSAPLAIPNLVKPTALESYYYAAFSPDNSKLYLRAPGDIVEQFDISVYDSVAISTSRVTVSLGPVQVNSGGFAIGGLSKGLRLYRDTIYVTYGKVGNKLSTINKPNLPGLNCDFDSSAIVLLGGGLFGLGNEVVYPIADTQKLSLVLDTLVCSDEFNLDLVANLGYNFYTWEDGTTGGQRKVNTPGTYWVKGEMSGEGTLGCNYQVDTFIIRGGNFPPPVITVNIFELSTTAAYDTYQWYFNGVKIPGATKRTLSVGQNGNYTVEVSIKEGCIAISDIYKVTNTGMPDSPDRDLDIRVYPNPTQDVIYINSATNVNATLCSMEGKVILEMNNATMIHMRGLAAGMYLLTIKDRDGWVQQSVKVIKY